MSKPTPERIPLPNDCYWEASKIGGKDHGDVFTAEGRFVMPCKRRHVLELVDALTPASDGNAIKCATTVWEFGDGGKSPAEVREEAIAKLAFIIQPFIVAETGKVWMAVGAYRRLVELLRQQANTTFNLWDKDENSKVGKRLAAMGGAKGILPSLDEAFADVDKAILGTLPTSPRLPDLEVSGGEEREVPGTGGAE